MTFKTLLKTKIAIIGAGFGGLGMGAALKKAGEDDFVILEKGHTVGGVWRDNTYPGCTCDVPSHLYSFSFAPYKSRDKRFPPQQEILAYLEQVTIDQGLQSHLWLNTTVTEALYHDNEYNWEVNTAHNHIFEADIVIFAVGQLHRPSYPKIPGLDTFCGPTLHPAEWDIDTDLRGKRVSIIGSGSSAAQMLPFLASTAATVMIYQRTPQWVLPKLSMEFGWFGKAALRLPGAHKAYRKALHHGADMLLSPIPRSKIWRKIVETYAGHHLHKQIDDEKLSMALSPAYPLGTKRILFDNDYYPALTLPNVTLIADHIKSIHQDSIQTSNSELATDVIVCATGFKASEFLVPMSVRGRGGRSLNNLSWVWPYKATRISS